MAGILDVLDSNGVAGSKIQEVIMAGLDIGFIAAVIFIVIFFVGLMIFVILYKNSFKHKIRIKDVINTNKIINDDNFKEFKEKDGTTWYKLFRSRIKIPIAPPEAIETDSKGRKVVEAYRLGLDEFIYIKDKNMSIPKELLEIKDTKERKEKIEKFLKDNPNTINTMEALTTQDRVLLVAQLKKAEEKKSKKWQDYLLPITGIAALVIMVVALMIFWGDMAKPILDLESIRSAQLTTQKETLELIKEIKNDIQVIKDAKVDTTPQKKTG